MSSSIGIVFDRDVAGYSPDDRCSLAHVFFEAQFDELAAQINVSPLKSFYTDDPKSLDWQIDDPVYREELKRQMGPAKFSSPADGLVSVKALLAQLKKAPLPMSRPGRDLNRDLLNELAEVERSLHQAEAQGARFYFVIVL